MVCAFIMVYGWTSEQVQIRSVWASMFFFLCINKVWSCLSLSSEENMTSSERNGQKQLNEEVERRQRRNSLIRRWRLRPARQQVLTLFSRSQHGEVTMETWWNQINGKETECVSLTLTLEMQLQVLLSQLDNFLSLWCHCVALVNNWTNGTSCQNVSE